MRVLVSRKTEHFHVAAVRQPAASIGVETSMPSTSQEGPARSASAIELQPISTTRSPGRSGARVWAELQVLAIGIAIIRSPIIKQLRNYGTAGQRHYRFPRTIAAEAAEAAE
jgi:hypothetical protein